MQVELVCYLYQRHAVRLRTRLDDLSSEGDRQRVATVYQ